MAQRKEQGFTREDRRLADTAKALGHPARIAILRTLAKRGTCICGELVEGLPLAQSTVSQHLKALKQVGLISGTVEGPKSCYCVNAKTLSSLGGSLSALVDGLHQDLSKCC
ncbi:MAG TPA: transcriptional regulator [Fibrobacteres bacterium]|jgi:ArsR family transcriptional regulator|nr:transcriptional regulator [Fibrobacterota bacterium]